MRKYYDEELNKLHELLVEMGNLCQEAIFMATRILRDNKKPPSTKRSGKSKISVCI